MCAKIIQERRQRIWYDPDVLVFHHRRPVFRPHLRQLRRYAEHRGYFVKRYPANSLELAYFLPAILVLVLGLGWWPALAWPWWWRGYEVMLQCYLGAVLLTAARSLSWRMTCAIATGLIASHVTYGLFFLKGLLSRRLPDEPPRA